MPTFSVRRVGGLEVCVCVCVCAAHSRSRSKRTKNICVVLHTLSHISQVILALSLSLSLNSFASQRPRSTADTRLLYSGRLSVFLSLSLSSHICICQFHQRSTYSFYAGRSRMRKKDSQVSSVVWHFWDLRA